MDLFCQKYPATYSSEEDSRVPVLIIPGLFGSSINWRSFAKQLGEVVPTIVIDQRNHGQSPHADSHTYCDMVADLIAFLDSNGVSKVHLCGHSMGGKAAMIFSLQHPERVESLIVLDIAPVAYRNTHAPYLEKMISLDLDSLESRREADKQLSDTILDTSTRLFLLQSLVGSRGSFRWRLNLTVLLKEMSKIVNFPSPKLDGLRNTVQAMFVNGETSDYLDVSHHKQIHNYFPSASFVAISDAGHWLHAEQPQAVLTVLLSFLQLGKIND